MQKSARNFKWLDAITRAIFAPLAAEMDDQLRRSIRMIIVMSLFSTSSTVVVNMIYLLRGQLHLTTTANFLFHLGILSLIHRGRLRAALVIFVGVSVPIYLITLPFSTMTAVMFMATSFVVVSMLLNYKQRIGYMLVLVLFVLLIGYLTADNPQYSTVRHDAVISFTVISLLSVTIAMSLLDNDREAIRQSLHENQQRVAELQRTQQALTRRNQLLTLLHDIQLDLLNRRDTDELLHALTNNVLEIVDAQYAQILLREGDQLVAVASSKPRFPLTKEPPTSISRFPRGGQGGHLAWQAHDTRRPAIVENYRLWEKRNRIYDPFNPTAVMNLPVLIGERCIAVLSIGRTHENYPFDEYTINIGMMYANLIALILDNNIQYESALKEIELRKQAEADQRRLTTELQATNEELKHFAHAISHDLKAPLRGITSIVDWLADDYGEQFDAEGQELLDLLQGRTQRMSVMIDGVLAYSRLGQAVDRKPVDLNAIITDVIEDIAPDGRCTITVDGTLPVIMADTFQMRQVFQNLIDNAIKHNDKPQCAVTITCTATDDERWRFSVADNGMGIDARYAEKIFGLFRTLAPIDDNASTGVGLAIVKRIIRSMGGEIYVESIIGQGSEFIFTLPDSDKG